MKVMKKKVLGVALLFMSSAVLFSAVDMSMTGFHNVDLAMNSVIQGLPIYTLDLNSDFNYRTLGEGYIMGMQYMRWSNVMFIFSGILFVVSLWFLL